MRIHKRYHVSRRRAALTIGTSVALVLAITGPVLGILPNSTFEGNDGNLVATAPNTDWVNAPNRVRGDDLTTGRDDNSFGQGTKEDDPNVSVVTGSIPPNKSDLTRFYVANEFAGGKNFLYLAWERSNVLGSANMDFEINQAEQPDLTTAGQYTLNRTAGDILITFDFTNGGGNPELGLLKWVTTGATSQCFSANSLPCWGNRVDLDAAGFAEGAVNTSTVTDPIAGVELPGLTFGEAAVNLTDAGVFPAGTCRAFGSAFLKSRASASFPAEVKDFVAPEKVDITNCGTIIINKVTENGDNTFGYTTTGGLNPATFNLSNGGRQEYLENVFPGNYSVTESTIPAGWTLKDLTCTATGGATGTPSGATANITMVPLGRVECTFTNHTKLGPTITTMLSAETVNIGEPVHDSATLTGATANAGGTVTYTVYTNDTCTEGARPAGTKTVTNGIVPDSDTVTFDTAGIFYWQAVYSGDANNNGATSVCTTERLVVKTNPSITTTLSSETVNIGDPVHDSATLTGATADAGGTVTYTIYTNDTCTEGARPAGTKTVTNGIVPDSDTVTFDTAGIFYWQAVYSGDAKNNGASSVCTTERLITKTNPTITTVLSSETVNIGDPVHDSATLAGATADASGTVTYTVYTNDTCTEGARAAGTKMVTNGVVPDSDTVTFDSAGIFYWQAVYSGDAKNNGGTSVCTTERLVVKTNPSITTTLSSETVNIGEVVHDSATLHGVTADASGTVTYTIYTNDTCTDGARPAGTKTVTNGVVPDSDTVTFDTAGVFYWQAVYSGDAKNNGATSVCTTERLVVKTNPTITTTLSSEIVNIGDPVHDSATLHGATADASGTVTYTVYTNDTCTEGARAAGIKMVTNGVVPDSDVLTFDSAGVFYWQAAYSGDAKNNAAISACTTERMVVAQNEPGLTTAQRLLPNDSATLTGATSGAGGTLTFSLYSPADTTCSGTPAYTETVMVNGNGTYSTSNTTFYASDEGTWRWLVTYSGDANNKAVTFACGVEQFTIANH